MPPSPPRPPAGHPASDRDGHAAADDRAAASDAAEDDLDAASDAAEDAETDRAVAAFLGLALGDAFGRPLEFKLIPDVRTMGVDTSPGVFHWTDDTQMAMYLARAILDLAPGPLVEDVLGRAIGRRFAEWTRDPLTPRLAPGNTCLRGARAFARHGDWQRSGDRSSDGCGAVMRIVPVSLAFSGVELVDAARISSIVTHAHPNAVEAAIAATWLCQQAVLLGRFDEGLVARAIGHLGRDWAWGGQVAESLDAALELAQEPGDWLDEESMPPGDGGWRSGSALGLAVASALRWGGEGFEQTVEKAARIDGDSDSVAALAGMFLGAAGGRRVLPAAWVDALPQQGELVALARACWARGAEGRRAPPVPAEPDLDLDERPTDHASDLDDDFTEDEAFDAEGFDEEGFGDEGEEVPLASEAPAGEAPAGEAPASEDLLAAGPAATSAAAPTTSSRITASSGPAVQLSLTGEPLLAAEPVERPRSDPHQPRTSLDHPLHVRWLDLNLAGPRAPRGRIGTCPAPGRVDGVAWMRHLGVDLDRLVALYQVDHLLLLLDSVELAALGIAALPSEAEARGIVVHRLPLSPGAAPTQAAAQQATSWLLAIARAGRRVAIVGREGEERPGMLAALALVQLGVDSDDALRAARAVAGPRAAGSADQRAFLQALAAGRS